MRFFTRLIALVPIVLSVASLADAQTAQTVEADLKNVNNELLSLTSLLKGSISTGAQVLAISIAAEGLTKTVKQQTVDTQNSPTFSNADSLAIVTTLRTVTVPFVTDASSALVKDKPQFDKLKATPDVVAILAPLIGAVKDSLLAFPNKFPDGSAKDQLGQVQAVINIQLGFAAKAYGI